jgi:hypothetical protein
MNAPDRLTLLSNLLLVLPVLLFLPGYILTRTFLRLLSGASFSETLLLRIFLSFIVTCISALGVAWGSMFNTQNLVLGVVIISFFFFLLKRFRFFQGSWGLRVANEDYAAGMIIMASLFLFFWPSEEIGSTFTLGSYLARTGSLGDPPDSTALDLLAKGPLGTIWFGVVKIFFGLKFSLLVVPILSVLSSLVMFFWIKRRFGIFAAISSVCFFLTNFTSLWFHRLPEGYALAQFLTLGAFYLTDLYFDEKNLGFLIAGILSLILACLSRAEVTFILMFFGAGFLIVQLLMRTRWTTKEPKRNERGMMETFTGNRKLPIGWIRFLLVFPVLWLLLIFSVPSNVLGALSIGLWLMMGCGAGLYLWKEAEIKDLVFFTSNFICPLFLIWQNPGEAVYIMNVTGFIPLILPSVCLFAGYLMNILSRVGRMAQIASILAVSVITAWPLYLNWNLLWLKEYHGVVKFYENLRKSFLPNDLVFSNDAELASFLWRLHGLKVYVIGSEGVDINFQEEILRWLADGGKAYVLSKGEDPHMGGFTLKLHSVERLRTMALERVSKPPEKKILQNILVRIYEAIPQ